jgi:nitrite reductase/ring-hydroxylating ferredoxin subunit
MSETGFVSSIKESELKEGHMKPVRVKGRPILLVRVGGEVFGVSNLCPHAGCSFEGGILTGSLLCARATAGNLMYETGNTKKSPK